MLLKMLQVLVKLAGLEAMEFGDPMTFKYGMAQDHLDPIDLQETMYLNQRNRWRL